MSKVFSFIKSAFLTLGAIACYIIAGVLSLVIAGAGIWISLFALGWFLAMIGIL
jgi:hypothetical protein